MVTVTVVGIPMAVAFLGGCGGRDQAAHGLRGADVRLLPGPWTNWLVLAFGASLDFGNSALRLWVVLLLGCGAMQGCERLESN